MIPIQLSEAVPIQLSEAERLILENQCVILSALSAILHAPGVSSGNLHAVIKEAVTKTQLDLHNARWRE